MMKLFNEAKTCEGPVIVHVLTQKAEDTNRQVCIRISSMEQARLTSKPADSFL